MHLIWQFALSEDYVAFSLWVHRRSFRGFKLRPHCCHCQEGGKGRRFSELAWLYVLWKNEMLIFKIARKKTFCHYSAIISVVQLYICLLVPFLLFGKPMNCISKKQVFWNQQTGIWMVVSSWTVPSLSSHFTSRRRRLTMAGTGRKAPTSKTFLQRNTGLSSEHLGTVYPVPLLLRGIFLSLCSYRVCCPRSRSGPSWAKWSFPVTFQNELGKRSSLSGGGSPKMWNWVRR